jgi:hypothetical protein
MERIGKILQLSGGVATIEVGLRQECVSGSCSDCHASAEGKWVFTVPWRRPALVGERVLVRARGDFFRLVRWLAFLGAFCLALAASEAAFGEVGVSASGAQRGAVLASLAAGAVAWWGARAWSRRQPRFRVQSLESSAPAAFAARRDRAVKRPFVAVDEVRRIDS